MKPAIGIYQAIGEMRRLTNEGEPFSLTFMTYNRSTGKSNGRKHIHRCLLAASDKVESNRYADHMLNYYDVEKKENRKCWQPLLMEFNGHTIKAQ